MKHLNRIRLYLRIGITNAFIVVGLVAGIEAVSGLMVSKPSSWIAPSYYLNHTWLPNGRSMHAEWSAHNPRFPKPYIHVYNAQGWLEKYDISREKPPNTFRIFYLGDSFIEGTAPMEQSLPSLVEKALLGEARNTEKRIEVINTGTSSYSPTIYYVLLRHVIGDYDPDLVVLNFDLTDDYDDWKYKKLLVTDELGNPWAVPPREVRADSLIDSAGGSVEVSAAHYVELFLYRHSNIYNLIHQRLGAGRLDLHARATPTVDGKYERWTWCSEPWSEQTESNFQYSMELLAKIATLVESLGAKLALSSTPYFKQYAGAGRAANQPECSIRPHLEVARVARALGIPYFNSYQHLAARIKGSKQTRYYYRGDIHFNPDGYRIWAESHIRELTNPKYGLLPKDWLR